MENLLQEKGIWLGLHQEYAWEAPVGREETEFRIQNPSPMGPSILWACFVCCFCSVSPTVTQGGLFYRHWLKSPSVPGISLGMTGQSPTPCLPPGGKRPRCSQSSLTSREQRLRALSPPRALGNHFVSLLICSYNSTRMRTSPAWLR